MNPSATYPSPHRLTPLRLLATLLVFALAFIGATALNSAAERLGWLHASPGPTPTQPIAPVDAPSWASAPPALATVSAAAPQLQPASVLSSPPAALAALAALAAPAQPAPPRWRTTLWMGGQAYPLRSGGVALPSGATFQVELAGLPAGEVRVYAINAHGEGTGAPLWAAYVAAEITALSPALRLEGLRGLETLRIEHRDTRGRLRADRVEIWHL